MRFRDLSIRQKLMALMMLTSSAALLLACVAFMTYESVTMRQQMARELSALAGIIGDNSTAALSFNDRKAAEETLATLGAKEQIVAAALYGADGALFARFLRGGVSPETVPAAPEDEGYRFQSDRLVLFRPVLMDRDRIGTVYVQSDLSLMVARLKRYIAIVIVVMAASTILALLLASRLQEVISGPIQELVETTRVVATGKNYAVRAVRRSRARSRSATAPWSRPERPSSCACGSARGSCSSRSPSSSSCAPWRPWPTRPPPSNSRCRPAWTRCAP